MTIIRIIKATLWLSLHKICSRLSKKVRKFRKMVDRIGSKSVDNYMHNASTNR